VAASTPTLTDTATRCSEPTPPAYWFRAQGGPDYQPIGLELGTEDKIRSVISRSCSCGADGSRGSCIPCSVVPLLSGYLNDSVVHFVPVVPLEPGQQPGSINCGKAPSVTPRVTLGEAAFSYPPCGCLASTLYHELLHNVGLDEPDTRAAEGKCTGELCGGAQSNVVEAIIVK
jgi:hypothetical protein